jgi:hypothetical protein
VNDLVREFLESRGVDPQRIPPAPVEAPREEAAEDGQLVDRWLARQRAAREDYERERDREAARLRPVPVPAVVIRERGDG